MNILTKQLDKITFQDVVDFCQLKILEGVTLEYKVNFPKDLSKQFVTFSNTQGGMIIIGIGEDANGLPDTCEGVDDDGKLVDRVYQIAANVTPFPTFDVTTTDKINGKVFVLIRIDEGPSAPYATNSDPTPWIRTGNISTPVTAANRDDLLRLLQKSQVAEQARKDAREFADRILQNSLFASNFERQQAIKSGETGVQLLGDDLDTLSISIMPTYPNKNLISERYLLNTGINDLIGQEFSTTAYTHGGKSIQGGSYATLFNLKSNALKVSQIYKTGHIFNSTNPSRLIQDKEMINIYMITDFLKHTLSEATFAYKKVGYNGGLNMTIQLESNSGKIVHPMTNSPWEDDYGEISNDHSTWVFETDTNTLNTDEGNIAFYTNVLKEVHWDLGLGEISGGSVRQFIANHKWYGLQPN